jgi:hypothetical protein
MSEADDEGCEPRRRDANPRFAPPAGRIDLAAPELATLDAVLLVALIAYSRFLFLPHKVRDISPPPINRYVSGQISKGADETKRKIPGRRFKVAEPV